MSTVIWWVRRDLRVEDNLALQAAASSGSVLPVFVDDPSFAGLAGSPRAVFLESALIELASAIESSGGRLVRLSGVPEAVLPALARSVGAGEVHVSGEFTPLARVRDTGVADALGGVPLLASGSPYAVAPGQLRREGRPFRVFTAFHRRWVDILAGSRTGAVEDQGVSLPVAWTDPGPRFQARTNPSSSAPAWSTNWSTFASNGLAVYSSAREMPGADGTSRLSAALRFGQVHPSALLTVAGTGSEFARQLAWRDFYADMLAFDPLLAWENADRRFDRLVVDTDTAARRRFAAFASARTGFPLVDAGVRELLSTGFVHNRVRMVMASFLVKDLHLPWQWGARFFLRHLVDGDLASNNLSWQWVAGSGFDAAPYHRVFNPTAQGERFDADGVYVRRHLPELAGVPDRFVHRPWASPSGCPVGYPPPMVDHQVERAEALARFRALRS